MIDPLRLLSLVQLMTLLGCGLAWHLAHRTHIPKSAWLVGWGYGYAIALVAAAVTLNEISDQGVTAGQRALTIGLLPATAWVLVLTIREALSEGRRAKQALDWLESLNDIAPCANPDCVDRRAAAARIADPKNRRQS